MDQNQAVVNSIETDDRFKPNKTIYDVSGFEVFGRNFLAGFGRALGGIFIYLIFIVLSIYSFQKYLYPQIKPFIDEYQQAVKGINQLQKTTQPGTSLDPQYQRFLQDLKSSLPQKE